MREKLLEDTAPYMQRSGARSRKLAKLIMGSVGLQYYIEMYLAGTVEGDSSSSVSLPERSSTRKWRGELLPKPTRTWHSKGPVCVRRIGPNIPWGFVECRLLEFDLLPSAFRQSNGREWTLVDLPPCHNFACDYDQDLLVLV